MKQTGMMKLIRVKGWIGVYPNYPGFDFDYTFIVPIDADLFTAAKDILAARHPDATRVDIKLVETLGTHEMWGL